MNTDFDEFKRKNNYRLNMEARVCANCVHYSELYEDRACDLACIKNTRFFREMWTEPNFVCDRFESNYKK